MLRVNRTKTPPLADKIRDARAGAALSQVELAQKLGVSPRTVQGWEAGRSPQPKHRRAVLQFLEEVAA